MDFYVGLALALGLVCIVLAVTQIVLSVHEAMRQKDVLNRFGGSYKPVDRVVWDEVDLQEVSAEDGKVEERIMIAGQSNPEENGIYMIDQSGLRRADDMVKPDEAHDGGLVYDRRSEELLAVSRKNADVGPSFHALGEYLYGKAPDDESVLYMDRSHPRRSKWRPASEVVAPGMFKSQRGQIPNRIHFMYGLWDDAPMPNFFKQNIKDWQESNPTYEIKVWGRADLERLVREYYPDLWTMYNSFDRRVQRADLGRYLILLHEGGWYADLDFVPKERPLHEMYNAYRNDASMILATELVMSREDAERIGSQEPIRKGQPEHHGPRVGNYFMGCCAKHPLMTSVVQRLEARCAENPVITRDYDILYTTGPDCMTTTYYAVRHQYPDVILLDKAESDRVGAHVCTSTWRDGKDEQNT